MAAVAFGAVLIFTTLGAESCDPRRMRDAAEARAEGVRAVPAAARPEQA